MPRRHLLLAVVTLCCWTAGFAGAAEPTARIHMLSGSSEYGSDVSLPKWAKRLRDDGYHVTIAQSMDEESRKNLAAADLLVVFCKRWKLSDLEIASLKAYLASGRPVLGVRTASHAFQTYLVFDNEVLGGTYTGHSGTVDTAAVVVGQGGHPVLQGLPES